MSFPGIVSISVTHFFLIGNIFWLFSLISSLFEQSMAFVFHSCGKSFTSAEKLRAHKAVHDENKIQCHICDKEFEGKKKFNNHIQSHHTIECEICHQTIKMNSRSNHSRKCGQTEIKASLMWHNSKRAGFVSPSDFRLRKSSPRVWGSPLSSPRLK